MTGLRVRVPGWLTTVQDRGRPGLGALGVGRSGAADRCSADLANRLVGNLGAAAVLEATLGGLELVALDRVYLAVTGADSGLTVGGRPIGINSATWVAAGQEIRLGTPRQGLRTYLAVRGGIGVPPVLGSRSTDTLAELGPAPLAAGDILPVGAERGPFPPVDQAPARSRGAAEVVADYRPGPREDWFEPAAVGLLRDTAWIVGAASNRIGVRLDGPVLPRARLEELPSEGVPTGGIQVAPAGPIVFLADHPVTGGYPVIGVVDRRSLDEIAQLRPGQPVRLRRVGG